MVSEARKQSMAWMETDYSKHTYFRWKVKWRLEHLGALGTMDETAGSQDFPKHNQVTRDNAAATTQFVCKQAPFSKPLPKMFDIHKRCPCTDARTGSSVTSLHDLSAE